MGGEFEFRYSLDAAGTQKHARIHDLLDNFFVLRTEGNDGSYVVYGFACCECSDVELIPFNALMICDTLTDQCDDQEKNLNRVAECPQLDMRYY